MEHKTHPYPPMLDILWTNILELKLLVYYVLALVIGFVAPIKMPFVAICFIMAVDMGTALVYVYEKDPGPSISYSEFAVLEGSNGSIEDNFGYSVAISPDGNYIAVGALFDEDTGN